MEGLFSTMEITIPMWQIILWLAIGITFALFGNTKPVPERIRKGGDARK